MILDTDVLIEYLRGNTRTSRWMAEQEAGGETLRYSAVSRAEVGAGTRADELRRVGSLFATLDVRVIDAETGRLAGERLRAYRKSHGLELADALIGAAAIQHGELLATFDRRHFPGVPRLVAPAR